MYAACSSELIIQDGSRELFIAGVDAALQPRAWLQHRPESYSELLCAVGGDRFFFSARGANVTSIDVYV